MKEQIALILRFVDKSNVIRQEFVSFLWCKNGLIDVGLYQTIDDLLGSEGLVLDCRGQDSSAAGKDKVLQTQVPRINPKLFTHIEQAINWILPEVMRNESNGENKRYYILFDFPMPQMHYATKLVDVCLTWWLAKTDDYEFLWGAAFVNLPFSRWNDKK